MAITWFVFVRRVLTSTRACHRVRTTKDLIFTGASKRASRHGPGITVLWSARGPAEDEVSKYADYKELSISPNGDST